MPALEGSAASAAADNAQVPVEAPTPASPAAWEIEFLANAEAEILANREDNPRTSKSNSITTIDCHALLEELGIMGAERVARTQTLRNEFVETREQVLSSPQKVIDSVDKSTSILRSLRADVVEIGKEFQELKGEYDTKYAEQDRVRRELRKVAYQLSQKRVREADSAERAVPANKLKY